MKCCVAYGLRKRYKLNLLLQFFCTIFTAALYIIYKGIFFFFPGVLIGQAGKAPCVFLIIKPTRCTNFSILFLEWNSTCFAVHHQEFFTLHTAMVDVIQVCWQLASRIRMVLRMTYTIAVYTVKYLWWAEELSEYVEFHSKNKIEELVHLVDFIIKSDVCITVHQWYNNIDNQLDATITVGIITKLLFLHLVGCLYYYYYKKFNIMYSHMNVKPCVCVCVCVCIPYSATFISFYTVEVI